jgi:DnaK suppressor protein
MDSKNSLKRLTSRLIAQRDALRRTFDADLDGFGEVTDASGVGDNVDAAVDAENEEVSSQLVEIESRVLGQIDRALHRIAEGVYGRCEFCGRKIPSSRLSALPYASSCIDCQRASENRGHAAAAQPVTKDWAKVSAVSLEENQSDWPIDPIYLELTLVGPAHRSLEGLLV